MTLPRTVVVAIGRWLDLLSRTSLLRANAIVRHDAAYTDITPTQYATAFDWLLSVESIRSLIENAKKSGSRRIPLNFSRRLALDAIITEANPSWLSRAAELVVAPDDLPTDVSDWGGVLGMADQECLESVRQVSGKLDLQARAAFGALGEAALMELLEASWPGSATQISVISDGFGYDISFRGPVNEWHLEVKSVAFGVRSRVFLSRHEFEVSLRDDAWNLVVVALDHNGSVRKVGVVDKQILQERSPRDVTSTASWQSCEFEFGNTEIDTTFCGFLRVPPSAKTSRILYKNP